MLPKIKRLNLKSEFKRTAAGKRIETPHFIIFLNSSLVEYPRVGISLSKKYFAKAHERNRARRVTSKAAESLYPDLRNKMNFVIMPKASVLETKWIDLSLELKNVGQLFNHE